MNITEYQRDGYTISTDKTRLDTGLIHRFLSEESYWAQGRPLELVQRSLANSLCFGVYAAGGQQVGFARVVTDYTTFAWLCDVFIVRAHRGRSLGKWLVETVIDHPDLAGVWRFVLATSDAHELYRRYGGFETLPSPERWMTLQRPHVRNSTGPR